MSLAVWIENLEKIYSGNKVLKWISLSIKEGDFYALLGANGAGKTTIIGIMTDLVRKNSGIVEIFGNNIDSHLQQAKACIGVVPQEFNFNFFDNVLNIVVTQAGYYGIPKEVALPRAEAVLKELDLWDKRNTQAKQLSGGMKRRLMIARALVHEPKLLILDEPTAGVDINLRKNMWKYLNKLNKAGTTILLTTHYLEEAEELCNRIAVINKGKIVAEGTKEELFSSNLDSYSVSLETQEKVVELPKEMEVYHAVIKNQYTIDAWIQEEHSITQVVTSLEKAGISVVRVENHARKIEDIFMKLTR